MSGCPIRLSRWERPGSCEASYRRDVRWPIAPVATFGGSKYEGAWDLLGRGPHAEISQVGSNPLQHELPDTDLVLISRESEPDAR